MFTLEQIKAAHSKVRSGADFPRYILEIKQLGLIRYFFFVKDGSFIYQGENGYEIKRESMYTPLQVNSQPSSDALRHNIVIHQQGQTDFMAFCRQAAEAGVEKWEINTEKMLCIYYDAAGSNMIEEPIPQAGY